MKKKMKKKKTVKKTVQAKQPLVITLKLKPGFARFLLDLATHDNPSGLLIGNEIQDLRNQIQQQLTIGG